MSITCAHCSIVCLVSVVQAGSLRPNACQGFRMVQVQEQRPTQRCTRKTTLHAGQCSEVGQHACIRSGAFWNVLWAANAGPLQLPSNECTLGRANHPSCCAQAWCVIGSGAVACPQTCPGGQETNGLTTAPRRYNRNVIGTSCRFGNAGFPMGFRFFPKSKPSSAKSPSAAFATSQPGGCKGRNKGPGQAHDTDT